LRTRFRLACALPRALDLLLGLWLPGNPASRSSSVGDGNIQGVGHYRTHPGLLGAGARQVNIDWIFVDNLHKS
jgi:hypothetical protein